MFNLVKVNPGLVFRPLSVFLVILVTRTCHSIHGNIGNGEVGNGLRDSGIVSANLNFLDYDLCLANYDVSEGSIIRTKDSQALGGHFINESDLGSKSREECLRLCCRTPHCNVISFEEKNSGSCYLFDCGPIENFRCKFTEQTHYMSAILRKRDDPLNNQHEAELSQLRNSEDNNRVGGGGLAKQTNINFNVNQSSRVMTVTVTPPAAAPVVSLDAVDNNSRHCSRRQFECKSSRECIAIYNACDGIPQCSDGSDESPELHCPSVDLSVKPKGIVEGGILRHSETLQQQQSQGTSGVDTSLDSSKSLSSSRAEDFRLAPSITRLQQQQQQQQLQQGSPANKDKNVNFETSRNMNIFNHKDGGIMDDTFGNQLQQQRQNPSQYWKSYDYGIGDTPNGYGPPIQQIPNSGVYGNGGQQYNSPYSAGNFPNYPQIPPYTSIEKPNMNMPPLLQQQPQQQLQPYYYNPNNNNMPGNTNLNLAPGIPPDSSRQPIPPVRNLPALGTSATPTTIVVPIPGPAKPTEKPAIASADAKSNSVIPVADPKKVNNEAEREAQLIQNLLSKTALAAPKQGVQPVIEAPETVPGAGAVLAFIVGLAMSMIMVIMIGCRLRRIKVGSKRRGKNRLDPDYLVDGMYL